jgi:DNA polymerase III gamma/tau subunit
LLKIIEDNPPHCYFIFCTTEPQNIIKTVRNRCAEYEVSLLSKDEIVEVLNSACKKKKLTIDKEIIEAISLTCEGSPRAALVSLEQVSEVKDVGEALELLVRGSEKDSNVIELYKLLITSPQIRVKKWKQIITTFAAIDEDSEKVRRALLTLLFNRLKECEDIEEAKDISYLLSIFSASTFYGGKSQLAVLIVKCLF